MTTQDTYVVKYGGGDEVLQVLKEIDKIIASEKSKLKSTEVVPPYMHLWQEWVNRKIFDNTTKAKLQRIVLNRNRVKRYEQPKETMKLILDEMNKVIPPFRDNFDYIDDQAQGSFIISATHKVNPDISKTGQNDHNNDQDKEKGWTEPKTYASIAKATPQLIEGTEANTNRFEILAQEESTAKITGKEIEMTTNDSDLSYSKDDKQEQQIVVEIDSDLSLSITSKDKEKQLNTEKVMGKEPKGTITPRATMKENNRKSSEISEVDTTEKNKDVEENDDADEDSDDLERKKSEDAEKQVITALANGTVDTLEVDILARWINKKTADFSIISRTLDNHETFLMNRMTRKSHDLHSNMKESLASFIKASVETKTETAKAEVLDDLNKIKSMNKNLKLDCKSIIEDSNKKMRKINAEIEKSESNSIININTCGNRNLSLIKEELATAGVTISEIKKSNEIAVKASTEVKKVLHSLHIDITNQVERFQDDITEHVDIERENFDQWMQERDNYINETKCLMAELKKETTILKAERDLIKKEKDLMIRDRIEMKQWFNYIKNEVDHNNYNVIGDNKPPVTQSNSTPRRSPVQREDSPTVLENPIPVLTDIIYKSGPYNVRGYITNKAPQYKNGDWYYTIHTNIGNELSECKGEYITVANNESSQYDDPYNNNSGWNKNEYDNQSSFNRQSPLKSHESSFQPPQPTQYTEYKANQHGPERHHQHHSSSTNHNRPLSDKEFIYPLGTPPKTIYALALEKSSKDWNLRINDSNDLRAFYERLRGKLAQYNILIKAYDKITKHTGLEEFNIVNCVNYENAVIFMSNIIFNYLDQYKATIFENYNEPIAYIDGFRRKLDGLGLLKNIMKKRHPNLREGKNETKTSEPKFDDYATIFTFVNAYIEWLHDETLRNNRKYTQKEQLDYILSELDDNFEEAKTSIRKDINELNLDGINPKIFPEKLTVNEELPLYIISLLPMDQQQRIYDEAAQKLLDNNNDTTATINVTKSNYRNRPNKNAKFDKNNNKRNNGNAKWADSIEWKLIPGATCDACQQANHNVYETGCPQLARFAICKEFYDKTEPEKLQPVIKAYKKYRKELNIKLKQRRNNDRKTIRTLTAKYDNDDMANIKQTLYNSYLEDFKDEQYCMTNPYDNMNDEIVESMGTSDEE